MKEIKDQDLELIFSEMGKEIASHGAIFSFLQLRVSAEHFVVPLCGFAADRTLKVLMQDSFHVTFEKKVKSISKGPIDLIILPLKEDLSEDWDNPYLFEFKMVWLRGFGENTSGLKNDLEKLKGYHRGYVIGIMFTFDDEVGRSPYKHKYDIDELAKRVKESVLHPIFDGNSYIVSNSEVSGRIKLIAWKA